MAVETKADEQAKPPGHALLEKMVNHHKDMLEGVNAELPMCELPEMKEGIKSHCLTSHKSMCGLVKAHGKNYKIKEPEWPEGLGEVKDAAEIPEEPKREEEAIADDDEEMKEDLPEDEAGEEEDLTDDEEKAMTDIITKMESQVEEQDKLLAANGMKLVLK